MSKDFNIKDLGSNKVVDEPKVEEKEQMVPLSMLQGMMDEIKELKEKQGELEKKTEKSEDKKPEDKPENIVRLLEYEDKLIVAFNEKRGTWKKWDKERREDKIMMEITLQDKDGKEEQKEVDYQHVMEEGRIIECAVKKMDVKLIEKEGKLIRIREVKDYKTIATKNKVRQIVKSNETMVKVAVPAPYNKEIILDVNYTNIR